MLQDISPTMNVLRPDTVRRREFLTFLASGCAWPRVARAQQSGKTWRIGWISGASRASLESSLSGFPEGMRDLGYIEGRNFTMEWRYAEGVYDRFPQIAEDLLQLKVDMFVLGTPAAINAVRRATSTVPIIMGYSTDLVGNGFVESLARPGGNITGLASSSEDTAPKQIELLATAVPGLARIGVLVNPRNPNSDPVLRNARAAAEAVRIAVTTVQAQTPEEIDAAFEAVAKDGAQAVMVTSDGFFTSQRERLVALALRNRLPSIFAQREYVEAGGLMSYGESLREFFRRAATFVDKIIKGAKPADLPIEQPALFKLVVNRRTADALGISIPPQLYLFAEEVIE
jgi:putative tryptophan/tyrosine transport system substrate-binding protein